MQSSRIGRTCSIFRSGKKFLEYVVSKTLWNEVRCDSPHQSEHHRSVVPYSMPERVPLSGFRRTNWNPLLI